MNHEDLVLVVNCIFWSIFVICALIGWIFYLRWYK